MNKLFKMLSVSVLSVLMLLVMVIPVSAEEIPSGTDINEYFSVDGYDIHYVETGEYINVKTTYMSNSESSEAIYDKINDILTVDGVQQVNSKLNNISLRMYGKPVHFKFEFDINALTTTSLIASILATKGLVAAAIATGISKALLTSVIKQLIERMGVASLANEVLPGMRVVGYFEYFQTISTDKCTVQNISRTFYISWFNRKGETHWFGDGNPYFASRECVDI